MIPSITFTNSSSTSYNTLTDWKLAPAAKPIFQVPPQRVQTVEIPGRSGVLDISNSLKVGGGPIFDNREGSFDFYFLDLTYYGNIGWSEYLSKKEATISTILSFLHGQFLDAIVSCDSNYKYHGRFCVENYTNPSDGSTDMITIGYSVEPYKINRSTGVKII